MLFRSITCNLRVLHVTLCLEVVTQRQLRCVCPEVGCSQGEEGESLPLGGEGERKVGARYEVRFQDDRFPVLAAYGFPCADAEMDAEPVGVRAGAAHAVYFRLRALYAVLPGVDAVFDLAGGGVWMLCVDFHGRFDCRCSRAF